MNWLISLNDTEKVIKRKTMEATDILKQEHRVIERVLNTLELGIFNWEHGSQMEINFFIESANFFKGFVDGCHHKKEEQVLFKTMADYGIPVENGPLGVMLFEHAKGREFIRVIRESAREYNPDDAQTSQVLIENCKGYVELLRQHIIKEDQVLFAIADQVIPVEKQELVLSGFNYVEHEETGEGIHEKYLALAEDLENYIAEFNETTP